VSKATLAYLVEALPVLTAEEDVVVLDHPVVESVIADVEMTTQALGDSEVVYPKLVLQVLPFLRYTSYVPETTASEVSESTGARLMASRRATAPAAAPLVMPYLLNDVMVSVLVCSIPGAEPGCRWTESTTSSR